MTWDDPFNPTWGRDYAFVHSTQYSGEEGNVEAFVVVLDSSYSPSGTK